MDGYQTLYEAAIEGATVEWDPEAKIWIQRSTPARTVWYFRDDWIVRGRECWIGPETGAISVQFVPHKPPSDFREPLPDTLKPKHRVLELA